MRTLKEFRGVIGNATIFHWEISTSFMGQYRFLINGRVEKESEDLSSCMYHLMSALECFLKYEDSKTLRIEGVDHEKKSA
jgi:hypothetical protein